MSEGSVSTLTESSLEGSAEVLAANASLSWLPALAAIVIAALFIGVFILIWVNKDAKTSKKLTLTIASVLWLVVFLAIEIVLSSFAGNLHISGSTVLFKVVSLAVMAGGVIAACAKVRDARNLNCEDVAQNNTLNLVSKSFSKINTKTLTLIYEIYLKFASWIVPLASIFAVTVICFIILEIPSNPIWLDLPDFFLSCEIVVILGFVAGLWLICQRHAIGLVIPLVISFVYGIAEYFVETFKATAIVPSDVRSLATGMAVANEYDYQITSTILICIALFSITFGLLAWIKDPLSSFLSKKPGRLALHIKKLWVPNAEENSPLFDRFYAIAKNVLVIVISILIGIAVIAKPLNAYKDFDWEVDSGMEFSAWQMHNSVDEYGLVPSFLYMIQLENLKPPVGYNKAQAQELQTALADLYDQFIASSPEHMVTQEQFDTVMPNIVLVMNESFADLSSFEGLGIGYRGPVFTNNLNAIAKGDIAVSVYGGGTCNSEFEGLTGTSLGFVNAGIYPFAVYDLSSLETVPKQLKSLGYETTAIHPELATNWGRDKVYPKIGFDQFIDYESFTEAICARGHVRDSATYDKVLELLQSNDEPQFVFDLTMMNHGWYETGLIPEQDNVNYDFSGILDQNGAAIANEYLSSMRYSDIDLQQFILQLKQLDEPVVLVFYGDHQPGFSWWFEDLLADSNDETAYQEALYQTTYFVWANYDIAGTSWLPSNEYWSPEYYDHYAAVEENDVEYTASMSSASLMSWALSYIGAPLTDYEKANYMSRYWLQSNNFFGYMDATGSWHASEQEEEFIELDVYQKGMDIIEAVANTGILPSENEFTNKVTAQTRTENDAIMLNVMKWLAYLNFSSKV